MFTLKYGSIIVMEQMRYADAAVVGSFFKDTGKDTGDVTAEKIQKLMDKIHILRSGL